MAAHRPPTLPAQEIIRYHDLPQGRVRSRRYGTRRPETPPVVVIMGMAVATYLTPAVACLGEWTEAHLVELPGFAGSGQATRQLDVAGYGRTVADWLDAEGLGPVVLAGHSSGTQVAVHTAAMCPDRVAAVVLASPTLDPRARDGGNHHDSARTRADPARRRRPAEHRRLDTPVGERRPRRATRRHARSALVRLGGAGRMVGTDQGPGVRGGDP